VIQGLYLPEQLVDSEVLMRDFHGDEVEVVVFWVVTPCSDVKVKSPHWRWRK